MAHDDQMQVVVLSDFRPGIASGWVSTMAEGEYPDGYAQEGETYGCYALPTGGLAPLPRITYELDGPKPETGYTEGFDWPDPTDGWPEVYADRIAVLDMKVVSPVHDLPPLEEEVPHDRVNAELFSVRQWWVVNGDDVAAVYRFRGWPLYGGSPNAGWVQSHLDTQTFVEDEESELEYWRPHPTRWLYGWGSIMETRTQSADNSTAPAVFDVGPPVLVIGMGTPLRYGNLDDEEGIEASGYWSWPDYRINNDDDIPLAQDNVAPLTVALDGAPPGAVFGHQGRLCSIGRHGAYNIFRLLGYHGDHDGRRASSEIVAYWPTNAIYAGQVQWATFLEEATTGYGTWMSVNANTLLLVKNKGGGVMVNGDISSPQVVRLPGLPSVGGLTNRGVVTQRAAGGDGLFADQGYVYGTSSGVWLWTGSDSATELSANLDARFWVPDDPTIALRQPGQLIGSFAFSFPYLYAPNNWMMDMRSGGWWRYHPTPDQDSDGTIFAFHETEADGDLWAMPASYVFDGRVIAKFGQQTPRSTYAWRSHPIAKSRGRMIGFRTIGITAAGQGRITVDLIGLDGSNQRAVWESSDDGVHMVEQNVGIQSTDVEVKVFAEASDPDMPAPTLHRITLGYREAQSVGGGR